jgi:hypothetical protein
MICPFCNAKNKDSAFYCIVCGKPLTPSGYDVNQYASKLKKMNVVLLIILVILTLGIYYPIWFIRQKEGINNLLSDDKIDSGLFIIIAIVSALSLLPGVYSGIVEAKGDWGYAGTINVFFNLIDWVSRIVLIIEGFKVRKILDTHFNTYLGKNERFSVIFTLFFGIYYLQYKINRLV